MELRGARPEDAFSHWRRARSTLIRNFRPLQVQRENCVPPSPQQGTRCGAAAGTGRSSSTAVPDIVARRGDHICKPFIACNNRPSYARPLISLRRICDVSGASAPAGFHSSCVVRNLVAVHVGPQVRALSAGSRKQGHSKNTTLRHGPRRASDPASFHPHDRILRL